MPKSKDATRSLILLILALVLAACGGEEPPLPTFTPIVTPAPPTIAPSATPFVRFTPEPTLPLPPAETPLGASGQVRVVQANAGLERVNIYLDTVAIGAQMRPGDYSNRPVEVSSGSHILRVMPAGQQPNDAAALLRQEVVVQPEDYLIMYLYGDAETPLLETYTLDLSPLQADEARISVIHAIPNGPGLNVRIGNTDLASGISYGQLQGPITLPAGTYPLTFDTGSETLLESEERLDAQQVYTVLILGEPGAYQRIIFREQATLTTAVRLVHAAGSAPALRILLDETVIAPELAYGAFSEDYLPIESGRYTLLIQDASAGEDAPPLLETPLNLNPNQAVELVIYEQPSGLQASPLLVDTSPMEAESARFRMVHAARDTGLLRLNLEDAGLVGVGGQTAFQLAPGQATPFITLAAIGTEFSFQLGASVFGTTPFQSFEEGMSYTVVVSGDGTTPEEQIFLPTSVGVVEQETASSISEGGAQVRFLNLSGEAATFAVSEESLSVEAGAYSETITIPGSQSLTYSAGDASETFTLEGGWAYTLILTPADELLVYDDPEDLRLAGASHFRVINLADADAFYFYYDLRPGNTLVGEPEEVPGENTEFIFEFMTYGGLVELANLAPGRYGIEAVNRDNVSLLNERFTVEGDRFYDVIMRGENGQYRFEVYERPLNNP